jgi:hypothetical protein
VNPSLCKNAPGSDDPGSFRALCNFAPRRESPQASIVTARRGELCNVVVPRVGGPDACYRGNHCVRVRFVVEYAT